MIAEEKRMRSLAQGGESEVALGANRRRLAGHRVSIPVPPGRPWGQSFYNDLVSV